MNSLCEICQKEEWFVWLDGYKLLCFDCYCDVINGDDDE